MEHSHLHAALGLSHLDQLSPHLGEATRAHGRAELSCAGLLRRKHRFCSITSTSAPRRAGTTTHSTGPARDDKGCVARRGRRRSRASMLERQVDHMGMDAWGGSGPPLESCRHRFGRQAAPEPGRRREVETTGLSRSGLFDRGQRSRTTTAAASLLVLLEVTCRVGGMGGELVSAHTAL